jgi:uncharacterized protein DUF4386
MNSMSQASPRSLARLTGGVYLLYFLLAIVGEFFIRQAGLSGIGGLSDDAAVTANLITSHESALRVGWAIGLASTACYGALTALLYELFRPVNRTVALIAAVFSVTAVAVQAISSVFELAPLVVLGAVGWLLFLSPPLATALMDYVEVIGFVAEASLMLWLLVIGVNTERWTRLVSEARA